MRHEQEICRKARRASVSSLGGKCWPMSPAPMAPSIASVSACRPASASEWPSSPWSCAIFTPHSQTWSPVAKRCASNPMPVRVSAAGQQPLGMGHIVRRRDLHVGLLARHADDPRPASSASAMSSVTSSPVKARCALRMRRSGSLAASARESSVARHDRPAAGIVAAQRIGHRQHGDGRIGAGFERGDHPARSGRGWRRAAPHRGSARNPAAPCQRLQAVANRILARGTAESRRRQIQAGGGLW